MYRFPTHLYCDVRIEKTEKNVLMMSQGSLENQRRSLTCGAFVRIFDGKRWFCSSFEDVAQVQVEIDALARLATPNPNILEHPVVRQFEVHRGKFHQFAGEDDSRSLSREIRLSYLEKMQSICSSARHIKKIQIHWLDEHCDKSFVSSLGADLEFDLQRVGAAAVLEFKSGQESLSESVHFAGNTVRALSGFEARLGEILEECSTFVESAVALVPGSYCTVLSPSATGVFAHESFGHKSEADFMMGSAEMRSEWEIGRRVGADLLSISDDGQLPGTGFVPFDDEGNRARTTWLVKEGLLAGRLHSSVSAAVFGETITGNARAMSFDFEPIVRMTCTTVAAGKLSVDELFAPISDGIYVKTIRHGSGMSTFTIAPARCYRIRNGKIAEPVKVAVVSGNVFETLYRVDGVANDHAVMSSAVGGCGKMEQWPLPVAFGGPHMRVSQLNLQ